MHKLRSLMAILIVTLAPTADTTDRMSEHAYYFNMALVLKEIVKLEMHQDLELEREFSPPDQSE